MVRPKGRARDWIVGLLRLVGIPLALIWAMRTARGLPLLDHVALGWLLVALIINQAALFVFAARLRWVLSLSNLYVGWGAALRIHLQSMFYFFVVPMTVGLEIARFVKIRTVAPAASFPQLAGALLADRLLGAASAGAIACCCLPFLAGRISVEPRPLPIAAGFAAMIAGAAALLLWPRVRIQAIKAWQTTRGRRFWMLLLFGLSMGMHLLFAAAIAAAAWSLALPVSFIDILFAVAGSLLLVAIPVSLAGLGPAEAGAAAVLIALGHAPSVALVAGALPYFARLIAAFEGGLWEVLEGGIATVGATRRLLLSQAPAR